MAAPSWPPGPLPWKCQGRLIHSQRFSVRREEGEGMMRLLPIFLGFLLLVGNGATALAASQKATSLRQANGLTAFNPPEKFLAGNFVADEMNPGVIFGTVKSFAASRQCPTAWLIEAGDKDRPAGPGSPDTPAEYTLYLEEDCPDQVVYYVFIDQSGLTPQQWIEWREKFHKSKAGEQFASAKLNWNRPARRAATSRLNYASSRKTGNS
jgi:hypothetical protein